VQEHELGSSRSGYGAEQITCSGVGSIEHPTSTGGISPQAGGSVMRAERFARNGVTSLYINAKRARDQAEAIFKKKEERLREGQQAMAEYEAARLATHEKTARLRALRLARDARTRVPASSAAARIKDAAN